MSLYRKYRPLTFGEIAGQDHIKQTLQHAIVRNELVHAYLFSGPRAVGKTTTARILTRSVNCLSRKKTESEPCNTCEACAAILHNRALDVIEIDAASHTGVDHVRDTIIAAARIGRSGLSTKVFIIDEVHMLSTSAFNALLKVLEEPPSQVLFILATTELHKVPSTIISRCQRFEFRKISPDAMRTRLEYIIAKEKKKVDPDVISAIIKRSEGCQRDAESVLGQILVLDDKIITKEQASMILPLGETALVKDLITWIGKQDTSAALGVATLLSARGADFFSFITDTLDYLRTLLLIKSGALDLVEESASEKEERRAHADLFDMQQVLSMIQYFMAASRDIRSFSLPELPLEVAIVKSCGYTDAHH